MSALSARREWQEWARFAATQERAWTAITKGEERLSLFSSLRPLIGRTCSLLFALLISLNSLASLASLASLILLISHSALMRPLTSSPIAPRTGYATLRFVTHISLPNSILRSTCIGAHLSDPTSEEDLSVLRRTLL